MENKTRGRKLGYKCSPETCEKISAAKSTHRQGWTNQDVLDRAEAGHSLRDSAAHFGVSFQRIQQILKRYRPANA